jgi:hypothetical protein
MRRLDLVRKRATRLLATGILQEHTRGCWNNVGRWGGAGGVGEFFLRPLYGNAPGCPEIDLLEGPAILNTRFFAFLRALRKLFYRQAEISLRPGSDGRLGVCPRLERNRPPKNARLLVINLHPFRYPSPGCNLPTIERAQNDTRPQDHKRCCRLVTAPGKKVPDQLERPSLNEKAEPPILEILSSHLDGMQRFKRSQGDGCMQFHRVDETGGPWKQADMTSL